MDDPTHNSDQMDRLRAIFERALDFENCEERDAFVIAECKGDSDLLSEIEALLRAEKESPDTFLAATTIAVPGTPPLPPPEPAGSSIGPYTLRSELGQGAFGTVWRAKQSEPVRREVALKIIKPGMDSAEVVTRFEAERQALALMDHPSIAQVYDAGTTELGRPYFVMELVRGVPITDYCDEKKISIAKRLELFNAVCRAVQHAHQKGVIHRDLKPSNILVVEHEGKALPKVIDFGIAKAIDQQLANQTLFTREDQFIGTPQYMSPEQTGMAGLDVDTRTDIYALGVLLYELLTGVTPLTREELKSGGWGEMERLIREVDPPKPSQRVVTHDLAATAHLAETHAEEATKLTRHLRGDLDWITMRALEKDRTRRYPTAHDFASDLERYLKDEPVSAGPPTVIYRTRKFIRRHRAATAALTSVALILIAATAVSTWLAVVARRAEKKSERSVLMIGDAYEGATELAAELLSDLNLVQRAVEDGPLGAESAAKVTSVIQDRAHSIVDAYYREGEIGGDDEDSHHMRSVVLNSRGYLARELGNLDEAEIHYRKALQIREKLRERNPGKALYLHNLAVNLNNLGDLRAANAETVPQVDRAGAYDEALEYYRQSLAHAQELAAFPEAAGYGRHDVALSHFKIAETLRQRAQVAAEGTDEHRAVKEYQRGLPIARELAASDADYPKWQALLGLYCLRLGEMFFLRDQMDEALTYLTEGSDVFQKLHDTERLSPENAYWRREVEMQLEDVKEAAR